MYRIRTAGLAALTAAAAIITTAVPAGAAVVGSDPPMGLMIQVSTLAPSTTPAKLKEWMVAVRKNHRDPSKPGYVNNLVLQDIADINGKLLTPYLDVIAPFLPGGATPAFTKLSIGGAAEQQWTGPGSKYIEGIQSPAFRERNVSLSVSTGKAFKTRYPKVRFDWYIPYEANVAAFWDHRIERGYLTYINDMTTRLSAVKSGSFSWSPSFWSTRSQMPAWAMTNLDENLAHFFPNLRAPVTVNLQDFVGQSGGASTRGDAVAWVRYLNRWTTRTQMNVEQFGLNTSGNLIPGDSVEVSARGRYYTSAGVPLGPSFDIRFWHARLYRGATP